MPEKQIQLARSHLIHRANDSQDLGRRCHERAVINRMRAYVSLHPHSDKMLILGNDHMVLFRHKEPGRWVFPERPFDGDNDTGG